MINPKHGVKRQEGIRVRGQAVGCDDHKFDGMVPAKWIRLSREEESQCREAEWTRGRQPSHRTRICALYSPWGTATLVDQIEDVLRVKWSATIVRVVSRNNPALLPAAVSAVRSHFRCSSAFSPLASCRSRASVLRTKSTSPMRSMAGPNAPAMPVVNFYIF
ncbi:hypothetical protein LshimejAT787_0701590 [Lyophyllum shimeji]|uniref:Uncharacterized protein n=1 Tax=Lyophyllum shimeji TaxID=47721 RepID=A0A9P3PQC2_LYOSH|nr:hypothetical protein LshimejAT787_0701590 [Lyophyllum shimeji]